MLRTHGLVASILSVALSVACGGGGGGGAGGGGGGGGGGDDDAANYALRVSAGTYNTGSGRLGVALLATVRDADGSGPSYAWWGSLTESSGRSSLLEYDATGAGSYEAYWLPEVAPTADDYTFEVNPVGRAGLEASFRLPSGTPLDPPGPSITNEGATLSWAAVPGAALYECRVFLAGTAGETLVQSSVAADTTCATAELGPGAYRAAILAYSADLEALAANRQQRPSLPARFDVSEGGLTFARGDPGAPVFVARAAGGANGELDFATMAVWLSITEADGTPTTVPWSVAISGPAMPPRAPLEFTYGANLPRELVWTYDVPFVPGLYSYTAVSTEGALAGTFTVGTYTPLATPTGLTASAGPNGSATVSWAPIEEARSYMVWVEPATSGVATKVWVSAPPARFPSASFTPGETHWVYLYASDVDMVGGSVPAIATISDITHQLVSFVAQ